MASVYKPLPLKEPFKTHGWTGIREKHILAEQKDLAMCMCCSFLDWKDSLILTESSMMLIKCLKHCFNLGMSLQCCEWDLRGGNCPAGKARNGS